MSQAYKCDRCGDLYKENSIKTFVIVEQNKSVLHFVINDSQWEKQYWNDICDNCIKEVLGKAMEKIGVSISKRKAKKT